MNSPLEQKLSLVSAQDLKERVARRVTDIVLVDARRHSDYTDGHIPGAISMLWEDWCEKPLEQAPAEFKQRGWWGRLADPLEGDFSARLADMGLRSDAELIVYADGPKSKGREGRIAWMLLYLGAPRVSLLDGGWQAWLSAGGGIESRESIPMPEEGDFAVRLIEQRRCSMAEMTRRFGNIRADSANRKQISKISDYKGQLLDVRTPEEYSGDLYSYLPRKGHIPGAVSFPYSCIFAKSGSSFITKQEYLDILENTLPDTRTLAPGKNQHIGYCEVGCRVSTFAFLHELYTGEIIRIYEGGLMEWLSYPELPLDKNSQD